MSFPKKRYSQALTCARQIPDYLRTSYPVFVEFLEAYYDFFHQNYGIDLTQSHDIDVAIEDFLNQFKFELSRYFPIHLVQDNASKAFIVKNLKDFYLARGSEHSFRILFRTLFNTEVEFYYPGHYLLTPSVSQWNQEYILYAETIWGQFPNQVTTIYLQHNNIEYSETVTEILQLEDGFVRIKFPITMTIAEYLNTNVELYVKTDGLIIAIGKIVESVIVRLDFVSRGKNWNSGQIFKIPGSSRDSLIRVTAVSNEGAILDYEVLEHGRDHDSTTVFSVNPLRTPIGYRSRFEESTTTFRLVKSHIGRTKGAWTSFTSHVSDSSIHLQDNFYYQKFSYQINANVIPSRYTDILKTIHPAGRKAFFNYELTQDVNLDLSFSYYKFFNTLHDVVDVTDTIEFDVEFDLVDDVFGLDTYSNEPEKVLDIMDSSSINDTLISFDDNILPIIENLPFIAQNSSVTSDLGNNYFNDGYVSTSSIFTIPDDISTIIVTETKYT